MNERLQLLAEQAKDYADYYSMLSDSAEQEIFTEKFAELIVRECINVSEKHAFWLEAQPFDPEIEQYEDGIVNGIYKATAAIKKHFGVEE
jgi:hypothetical protein